MYCLFVYTFNSLNLRTVPSFVTVHTFCASRDIQKKQILVLNGDQNPKRKLGVTMHFSEKIKLKFGKKLPYILCILTLF